MYCKDKLFSIYAIRCKTTGRVYIGRSSRIDERIQTHFSELKNKKHSSKLMIEDFEKYGKEDFEVYILEENIAYEQRFKEYEYMKKYNSFEEKYGYNRGDKKIKNKNQINYIYGMPQNNYEKDINQEIKEE